MKSAKADGGRSTMGIISIKRKVTRFQKTGDYGFMIHFNKSEFGAPKYTVTGVMTEGNACGAISIGFWEKAVIHRRGAH